MTEMCRLRGQVVTRILEVLVSYLGLGTHCSENLRDFTLYPQENKRTMLDYTTIATSKYFPVHQSSLFKPIDV
jgi:hypothetical protein